MGGTQTMRIYKIILAIAIVASIIPLSLAFQNKKKEMDKGAVEKSWEELVDFAKDNEKELTQVSKTLLRYKDKITLDKTPLDYEALITEENETVKQDFLRVFKMVGFSYETITNKTYMENDIVCYFYNYSEGTTYGILYFTEESGTKQDIISLLKESGDVVQITNEVYAYYHHPNYT
jgi:hypothetical protein